MHSSVETAEKIPAFLYKLWKLVEDKSTDHLIRWGEGDILPRALSGCHTKDGRSFILCSQAEFSHKLLPLYYKHNNMASFVRQLNMYGFRKVPSMDGGGLRPEKDEMEFAHPYFIRGQENSLELIKRKQMSSRMPGTGTGGGAIEDPRFSEVLSEVKALRQKQDSVITQMSSLKRENQLVYAKYRDLQTKFTKQQNIISKLMRFIVTMMKPGQLSRSARKLPHLTNPALYPGHNLVPALTHGAVSPLSEGPVIHEVVDDVVPSTGRTRPQAVCRAKPAQLASSSGNVVLQATPAVQGLASVSSESESLLDPGLHETIAYGSQFAFSPRGVILHSDGQPVSSSTIINEPPLDSFISPQPIVESPQGSILSSELPQRNIKIEYLQDESQAAALPVSSVPLTSSPATRVAVNSSLKPTVAASDAKPKIMSYVRASKEGFSGAGKNTFTYTMGPNNTFVRADSSASPTTGFTPIIWNAVNSRSSNSTGAVESSTFREDSSNSSVPSDRAQNVITSVTVIPSDSNARFSNPTRIPGKVLTTSSNSAIRLKNTQGKDGRKLSGGQTASGPYIIRRTIGNKNASNNNTITSSSSGPVVPTNSAIKRRLGESAGSNVPSRRSSTDALRSHDNSRESVPMFKVVQMNPSQQNEETQDSSSSVKDFLAQALESANLATTAPPKEVTDVVPAHGSLGRDASGGGVVGQFTPTDSLDLILANDSTSVAVPPSSSSEAATALSPHDQVMKKLDEMEEAVENLQEIMKNNNIPCEPSLMSKIFNPDYPYTELDFINDFDMSYDTMGLANDSSNNQQQLSLYNPASMDLSTLVDSPTGDDLSEDEPFAMASFDPEFITTPKADTVGNNRKRIRGEGSDECNDELHPLLKDLC